MFSFIETRLFTRLVQEYLSDEQYMSLQRALIENPNAGAVMVGTGGIRKLRCAAPGRGKRGGYRVIYCMRRASGAIWLLTIYPKNVMDEIPLAILKHMREKIEDAEG